SWTSSASHAVACTPDASATHRCCARLVTATLAGPIAVRSTQFGGVGRHVCHTYVRGLTTRGTSYAPGLEGVSLGSGTAGTTPDVVRLSYPCTAVASACPGSACTG